MKRVVLAVGLAASVAAPAAAQWTGMPVWNSPKGGTGITISGDWGRPDSAAGTGASASHTKFGFVLGANLGFGLFGLHAAYDYQDSDTGDKKVFGLGAHVAIKVPLGM